MLNPNNITIQQQMQIIMNFIQRQYSKFLNILTPAAPVKALAPKTPATAIPALSKRPSFLCGWGEWG